MKYCRKYTQCCNILYAPSFSVGPFQVGAIRLFCLSVLDKVLSIIMLAGRIYYIYNNIIYCIQVFLYIYVYISFRFIPMILRWRHFRLSRVITQQSQSTLLVPIQHQQRYVRTVHLTGSSLHYLEVSFSPTFTEWNCLPQSTKCFLHL